MSIVNFKLSIYLQYILTMRYYFIILPIVVLLTVVACGQEEKFEYTPGGYPFKYHINKEGESPKPGEFIHFRLYIRNQDSIVHSTQKNQMGTDVKEYVTAPFILHKTAQGKAVPQMDAFSIMSPGDSITLYYRLDTLDRKPDKFENSDYMYYDLVLVDVLSKDEHNGNYIEQERKKIIKRKAVRAREPEVAQLVNETVTAYKKGELNEKITTTASGLKYIIVKEGEGEFVRSANYVDANYYGTLMNGEPFESSFTIGDPVEILIGQRKVIPGLEELFKYTNKNTTIIAFIPSELAYGDKESGPIPANADIVFYVEVVGIR